MCKQKTCAPCTYMYHINFAQQKENECAVPYTVYAKEVSAGLWHKPRGKGADRIICNDSVAQVGI